jgi:hypothetical protein
VCGWVGGGGVLIHLVIVCRCFAISFAPSHTSSRLIRQDWMIGRDLELAIAREREEQWLMQHLKGLGLDKVTYTNTYTKRTRTLSLSLSFCLSISLFQSISLCVCMCVCVSVCE